VSPKLRITLSAVCFVIGITALSGLYYYGPKMNRTPVVIAVRPIKAHQPVTAQDVAVQYVHREAVPKDALRRTSDIVGQTLQTNVPQGSFLFGAWFEVDVLQPKEGEVLLPVPNSVIFAMGSSLRMRDTVHLYFFEANTRAVPGNTLDAGGQRQSGNEGFAMPEASTPRTASPQFDTSAQEMKDIGAAAGEAGQEEMPDGMLSPLVIRNVLVSSVWSANGNVVMDTAEGKDNDRKTSSEKINAVELLVKQEIASQIQEMISRGYKLWIVRAP